MHGPELLARFLSTPGPPDSHGNVWQYNSRSDRHSKVGCWGVAFDLILTARTVQADEALRLGLVSRLSADDVVADALAIAETLCSYGKFGVESTKQVLWANLEASSLEAALHLENRSQILSSTSGEMREAAAAILRKP